MLRTLTKDSAAVLAMTGAISAEPFQEITIGVPVASIAQAEAWYLNGPVTVWFRFLKSILCPKGDKPWHHHDHLKNSNATQFV